MKFITNPITLIFIIVFLVGCTSIPKDLGRSDVDALVSERGISVDDESSVSNDELVNTLISEPLTAESAIRIALVNNSQLKATYADLGIAAADVYEAGRIRNPVFSVASLDTNESGERNQTTFGIIASFTDLLTLPSRKKFAEGEFAKMKMLVSNEVLKTAAEAESAFYHFVASKQVAALRTQIAKAGSLSLELAKRYYYAGNLTPREFALEHASASEFQIASLETQAEAYSKRVELATFLGISAADDWDSPANLPLPLNQEDDIDELIELANKYRLDLAAASSHVDLVANKYGVTKWTSVLGEIDIGIEHERETDGAELTGPVLEWEIPIFGTNRNQRLRAQAELKKAIVEMQHLKIAVENEVRLAHAATQNVKARVDEYRKKLIPARMEAVEFAQEEENFMLIGIFELLESKQEEYDAYQGYIEVVRDYWLARTELANVVGNTLPSSTHVGSEQLNVEEYIAPKESAIDHSGHTMQKNDDHSGNDMKMNSNESEHDAHSGH
ncbi:MAG: TolC family protein [Gammaproteobacteria bacterium]